MANRVLLGKRGSDYGLWVSKTGANVLTCDPEDMLIDANRAEIVSQPLDSGTGTVTFTSSGGSFINADSGFINYNATYDYIPILMYTFVDSGNNRVYPMYYENSWTNTITRENLCSLHMLMLLSMLVCLNLLLQDSVEMCQYE